MTVRVAFPRTEDRDSAFRSGGVLETQPATDSGFGEFNAVGRERLDPAEITLAKEHDQAPGGARG